MNKLTTNKETKIVIKSFPKNKSSGLDGFTGEVLSNLGRKFTAIDP